jgi:rhamnogalacturonan endolyase
MKRSFTFMVACVVVVVACLSNPRRAFGAFGLTSGGGTFSVDTGAGLVFQVATNSGDIKSIIYNGVQYQATDKNSQIASGLGTATVTATNLANQYIRITCTTAPGNTVVSSLTHYLIVTNGLNTIFMGTFATAEPAVGELRWITRLQSSKLTFGPIPSDTRGNTGAIESTDILGMADGTTRSKYYGDTSTHGKDRAMDLTYCGATGTAVGVWMVFDNPRESDAGGPFFRDIENQDGGDQEVYNYMNSGHNQTESYRTGVLYGPYALVFNNGSPPAFPIDYSWIETSGLNLTGFVARASRGAVTGSVSGIPAGFQGVVGFANTTAQYCAVVTSNGTYTTPLMKTGTYTATLYKGELGVTTSSTTVSAGVTNTLNLTSGESTLSYVVKIGEWDGTPNGFLNATNIVAMIEPNFITMHPQDVRMTPWVGPTTYVVESNSPSTFPSIQMRLTNSPTTIKFNLAASQITNMTLRIGITCAYHSGRPQVSIGSFTSGPSASTQPDSRSFTIGTYRGNNALFTYNIPSNNFVVGENALTITPISGTADLGPWLSAGWVYDAVELDGPFALSPPSAPTGLTAVTSNTAVVLSWNASSGATGYNVKRSLVSGGLYATIASNLATTSYTDTNVVNSTTYYYVASALNAGGESANSAETSAYVLSLFEQWQMDYFNCTNCPLAAASADPDGDGQNNQAEFLAGTDPTNSASGLRILSISPRSNDILIIWATAGGRTNAVQAADGDGTGGYNTNFTDISVPIIISGGGDAATNYLDVGGETNIPARYYRVRLVP